MLDKQLKSLTIRCAVSGAHGCYASPPQSWRRRRSTSQRMMRQGDVGPGPLPARSTRRSIQRRTVRQDTSSRRAAVATVMGFSLGSIRRPGQDTGELRAVRTAGAYIGDIGRLVRPTGKALAAH